MMSYSAEEEGRARSLMTYIKQLRRSCLMHFAYKYLVGEIILGTFGLQLEMKYEDDDDNNCYID